MSSLSTLLNDDDSNDKEEAVVPIDKKVNFLNSLNSNLSKILNNDELQLQLQDWKFINLQEFELISNWNVKNIQLNEIYNIINDLDTECNDYFNSYKIDRLKLIKQTLQQKLKEDEQEKRQQPKSKRLRNSTTSKVTDIKMEDGESENINSLENDSMLDETDQQILDLSENQDVEDDNRQETEEDEDDIEDEIEDDEENEEEEEVEEDLQSEALEVEDNDDKDFTPDDYSKPAKYHLKDKSLNLNSDKTKIVRELIKMSNKNKIPRIKKRKFTNCLVMDYKNNSKVIIKITLKQFHVRKLKRLLNESKRKREEEQEGVEEEQHPKRRRFTDDKRKSNTNNNHDLPTYGMKLSLKEARAIKRHHDNTYITIWKDMARKDSNKMLRLIQQIQSTRYNNFRKTSSLCAREARKWQSRNFKQIKDMQTRARRGIREMSNFWKRNEREEREVKRKAEKVALEAAKKEEEEREAKRQAKKLNFLLTQTELYSHFIGRKIKTNEIEGNEKQKHINDDIDLEATSANKNEFNSIDFDNETEEQLRLKAAENASSVLAQTRAKAKEFDNLHLEEDNNEEELNFQNPTSLGEITIDQSKLLACTLKEYQLKGLNWLANLYDQGINGILADEMGLGKTVQSISVLAHLAERYNIWGPFLVVTPASTLHNWVNEISKFVPDFKILPYWGNAKDRKVLRKFWDRKNLRYTKDAPFHVMVTSYQMVVSDVNYLQKMKWQYMILDEAQAIKSSQSSRWRNLLSFHCRNRLLLTGTPIQNNMQELWALLHFIMPSLFDSHDEFSEWFSRDIESHAESNTQINQQQLRRLHMILKPFMLRRIKKNVQSELGDKIEIDVLCDLTQRQEKLYKVLKSQVSSNYDAIENAAGADDAGSDQNLVNYVMQFRKVCNHPDLFERADVDSPFAFVNFGRTSSLLRRNTTFNGGSGGMTTGNSGNSANISAFNSSTNLKIASNSSIDNLNNTVRKYFNMLEVVYSTTNPIRYSLPKLIYEDLILPNFANNVDVLHKIVNYEMNILNPTTNRELCETLSRMTGLSFDSFTTLAHKKLEMRAVELNCDEIIKSKKCSFYANLLMMDHTSQLTELSKETTKGVLQSLLSIKERVYTDQYWNSLSPAYQDRASASPISIQVLGSSNFTNKIEGELFDPVISQALSDIPPIIQYNMHVYRKIPIEEFPKTNLFPEPLNKNFASTISMPSMDRFITESAKLKKLDEMLPKLKSGNHRVLIYFQMTKMMDLMEEYLTYRQYNHIRLDGSSKLEDRRDLVHDWQTKPEIFIFLLSTRAGGLGINLTAADTVIFYDSDWNPTIDSQAMDRAHRLGQTRQVTVYRLLVKGTIEERMRDRAKQKEQVQQVVMEGKTQENNVRTIETTARVEKQNISN
ncbi:hypothetical protein KAFR_0B04690 [Kazachstania africana CBS 2517]|uniref:Chromatin-remodeling ATPase INO80 n=1 Tax=Kazachstania africana (strain ATCC 22294 / BCRC 22015 / CBS 2517 / CECT 1963 / NBRC 1671 / NRRL Y-8276) TaxID=1071382 RepID=H2AQW6_KAZAF|nr:hypothetical protein KAFR_0B04690 [Kazachstania africana CBS 2517]CCF56766.1 hypothetical protein KAFR_0B04690 [Kazachstania africana CBS 2517]